jgi:hypothetical protein
MKRTQQASRLLSQSDFEYSVEFVEIFDFEGHSTVLGSNPRCASAPKKKNGYIRK